MTLPPQRSILQGSIATVRQIIRVVFEALQNAPSWHLRAESSRICFAGSLNLLRPLPHLERLRL